MKVSNLKQLLAAFFTVLLIISCGGNNASRGTGWDINSKKGGFQYNTEFDEQETGPGLVFIEGGTFTKGQVQDDVMHDWNNTPNKQHVMSFYIDETEVTNVMYLEYLDWLEIVFPTQEEQYRQIYEGALPDTLVWRERLGYVEELTTNYLRHPAYAEYPVVGVNWLQAVQYAEWRTDRVNERILEREAYVQKDVRYNDINANSTFTTAAYLKRPETVYGGKMDSLAGKSANSKQSDTIKVYAGVEKGIMLPSYRLPTETEWEYAARGGEELTTFPWGGPYATNSAGCYLANFKPRRGNLTADGGFYPVKTTAYSPNGYNLYCMSGNVSEWTSTAFDVQSYAFASDVAPEFQYNAFEDETKTMKRKVIRGGSWKDVAYFMQLGARDYEYQDTAKSYIGFRTVQSFIGRDLKDF